MLNARPAGAMLRQADKWRRFKKQPSTADDWRSMPKKFRRRPAVRPVVAVTAGGHLQLDATERLYSAQCSPSSPRAALVVGSEATTKRDFLARTCVYVAPGLPGRADYRHSGERGWTRATMASRSRTPADSLVQGGLEASRWARPLWTPTVDGSRAVCSHPPAAGWMRLAPRLQALLRRESREQGGGTVLPIVDRLRPPGP